MAMNRAQKENEVKALKARFEEDEIVVITHYSGLTVSEMSELRSEMRKEGARFKVAKNTLTRRALEGTKFEHLVEQFKGPTGIASSQDPVAAARVAHKFAKDHKNLVIIGGGLGAKQLDPSGVEQLAKLPSMDELRGTLVGLIQAPATKLARLSKAPAGKLARVVSAYAEKGE